MLSFHCLVFVMLSGALVSHSALRSWFSVINFVIAFICSHDVIHLCISAILTLS
jgi:hypothetical protein